MRNLLLVAGMVLAATACGAYQFPGSSPSPDDGTVSGRVIAVPCSPIEPAAGSPCAGRPMAGVTILFSSGGTTESAVTGPDGRYAIRLSPGLWKVSFKTFLRVVSGPSTVNVAPGANVVVDYIVDSGIRAPALQQ